MPKLILIISTRSSMAFSIAMIIDDTNNSPELSDILKSKN